MDISAQQLHDIRAAYTAGHLKQVVDASEQAEIELEADLTKYTIAQLPPAEQELVNRCGRYRMAALKACREGKYAIAEYLFADIAKFLDTQALSPMGRLVAQSGYEAAVAYLDYRHERFERGTEHIYRALACDEALEQTYGLTHYHLRRLRQVVNFVRLKRRQGEGQEVLLLGNALMDYLEQKTTSLPFPTTWDSRCLDHLPLLAKNFLFEQAMCEIMFLIVGQEDHYPDWLAQISEHTTVTASSHCQLSPQAHLWLQAKRALQERHLTHFCEMILPLLAEGPTKSLWFWYGCVIDVVLLCRDLAGEPAELLVQTITEDMPAWRWSKFPPAWKHIFETTAQRVHA